MLSSSLVNRLVKFDLDINKKNTEGQTALMLAAKNRNLEAMTALLESPLILISTGDKDNKTVLHILLETFHKTDDETCKSFSHILTTILKLSSEVVNWKDNKGVTPIMIAAKNKQLDVVDYLLECGAVVKTEDKCKETILHLMLQ